MPTRPGRFVTSGPTTRPKCYRLGMDEGDLVRCERHFAEGEARPSLDSDAAQAVARASSASGESTPDRSCCASPRRRSDPIGSITASAWEAPEKDPRNVGEARHRVEVTVLGDVVGTFEQRLKLPESWEDVRKRKTAAWGMRVLDLILVGGAFLGMALWILVRGHRRGETRWQASLLLALPFGLLTLLSSLNAWPRIMLAYQTEIPWNTFVLSTAATLTLSATFVYFVMGTAVAGMTTRYPDIWGLHHRTFRRTLLPDAFLGAALVIAVAVATSRIFGMLPRWLPELAAPDAPSGHAVLSSVYPGFQLFAGVSLAWAWQLALVTLGLGVLTNGSWRKSALVLLVIGASIAMVPLETRGWGEFLVAYVPVLTTIGFAALLVRFVLRSNLLAYPLALVGVAGLSKAGALLGADGPFFRNVALLGLLGALVPVLWLLASSLRSGRSPRP
ncbi:MAG: hypothetical protein R3E12_11850 [Candidatus Eisenbacteria bacterium]